MPSASLTTTAPHDGRKVDQPDVDELLKQADQLLTVMASIRRSGRLLARRPVELSTLTGSQIDLVSLVRRRPGVSVAQAAEELQLAPNTVSTLVRQLTDERLVLRRVDPIDRRVARLELTAGMERKVGAFLDRRLTMLGTAMNRLSTGDQRRITDSLAALVRLAERLNEQETTNG